MRRYHNLIFLFTKLWESLSHVTQHSKLHQDSYTPTSTLSKSPIPLSRDIHNPYIIDEFINSTLTDVPILTDASLPQPGTWKRLARPGLGSDSI